jgi:hypothetical protein
MLRPLGSAPLLVSAAVVSGARVVSPASVVSAAASALAGWVLGLDPPPSDEQAVIDIINNKATSVLLIPGIPFPFAWINGFLELWADTNPKMSQARPGRSIFSHRTIFGMRSLSPCIRRRTFKGADII